MSDIKMYVRLEKELDSEGRGGVAVIDTAKICAVVDKPYGADVVLETGVLCVALTADEVMRRVRDVTFR